MRLYSNILSKYIIKEILSVFVICLFVFTSLLFLIRSLQLTDLVVNKSVPLWDMVVLFSCIIPRFLEFAIPISILISVILAFGRLCADSEIIVMKASGLNLFHLARPVLLFAIGCMCATLVMTCWLRPTANAKFSNLMFETAASKANSGIVAGIFNEIGDLVIYAKEVNHETKKCKVKNLQYCLYWKPRELQNIRQLPLAPSSGST
jgi:lipopolysaccharide export system permease protein